MRMFGRHKTQGREAGLATSNSFGAVSLGTSLFSFDKGFQPTHETQAALVAEFRAVAVQSIAQAGLRVGQGGQFAG